MWEMGLDVATEQDEGTSGGQQAGLVLPPYTFRAQDAEAHRCEALVPQWPSFSMQAQA